MPKDKSEKREKKEKKPKVDDAEADADAEDVEMADVSEVSASHVSKCPHVHIILVPEKSEEGERNHHSIGRFISSCAAIGTEKACEKAAQNDQKRFAYLFLLSGSSAHYFSASKARQVKRGVKEVVKGIRKGEKGYVLFRLQSIKSINWYLVRLLVLAADINPIDIISHLPVLSEEAQIPYVFVTSKEELGHASSTKRPTSCVMICPDQKRKAQKKDAEAEKDDDYRELYEECRKEVAKLDHKIVF